ncbi:MAG: ABC transporter permease [Actinomycetota bacterium]|jgi:peptide/nickel transport system permease protein|nr:ABC transporter permease [Actinomycetota bacterium]
MNAEATLGAPAQFELDPLDNADVSGRRKWRSGSSAVQTFFEHRLAIVGLVIAIGMVLFCFVGPLIYHTDQVNDNLSQVMRPPSSRFPLGTDALGHNVLGRLMVGGQSSIEMGIAAAFLASIVGTIWGAVAGFVGGAVDAAMMRVVDTLLAIPTLLLMLMVASIFTPTIPVLILALTMVSWLVTARLVRAEALSLRSQEYVQAAVSCGSRRWRIVFRHIIPNAAGTIVVQTTFQIANAILLLAALSFLGLGPPPPATNWGEMLTNGLTYIYAGAWWLIYPAGIAIVLTVLSFNFLGDALRDALDVRLQRR